MLGLRVPPSGFLANDNRAARRRRSDNRRWPDDEALTPVLLHCQQGFVERCVGRMASGGRALNSDETGSRDARHFAVRRTRDKIAAAVRFSGMKFLGSADRNIVRLSALPAIACLLPGSGRRKAASISGL